MAISFNGSSSKLQLSANLLTGTKYSNQHSLFAWIKPTSATANYMVGGAGDTAEMEEFGIYAEGAVTGKVKGFNKEAGGTTSVESTTAVSTAWQPVLITWTSTALGVFDHRIYYAGGAVVSNTSSAAQFDPTAMDRFVIGVRMMDDTLWFNGEIAEVALWSSVLTQGNFDSLAGGALPESIASGSLIDAWTLRTNGNQTGVKANVLTASNTSQGGAHPISRGGQSTHRNGIALASISAINGIAKASVSRINGLTI